MEKGKVIEALVSQIQNMYENDIIEGYGTECFEGWCEDGNLFRDSYDDATEDELYAMIIGMKQLAPYVNALTQKIEEFIQTLSEK